MRIPIVCASDVGNSTCADMIATSFMFCLLRLATGLVAPEQVHLSYGYLPSEMFVMWATDEEASSRVHVTLAPANMKSQWAVVEGECWNFSYGNPDGLQIIHRVNLTVRTLIQISILHVLSLALSVTRSFGHV